MHYILLALAIAVGVYAGRKPKEAWVLFKRAGSWLVLIGVVIGVICGISRLGSLIIGWMIDGTIYTILYIGLAIFLIVIGCLQIRELYIAYFSKKPEHVKAREERKKEKEKLKNEKEKAKKEKREKMTDEEKEEYYRLKKKNKKDWIIIILCLSPVWLSFILAFLAALGIIE